MLTTLNHLLVPTMFENYFQGYLFYDLPRDQDEPDQPVVP